MVSKRLENQKIPKQCNFRASLKKNIQEPRGTIDQVHTKMLGEFFENDILGVQIKIMRKELTNYPVLDKKNEETVFNDILSKMQQKYNKGESDMIEYLLNLH